jgi:hypothetical protein
VRTFGKWKQIEMGKIVRGFVMAARAVLGTIGFSLIAVMVTAKHAEAFPTPIAAVQCDAQENQVLIRFETVDSQLTLPSANEPLDPTTFMDTPKIPSGLESQWARVPYRMAGDCKLKNGEIISVTTKDGIVGEGWNQALPDEYFTLTIDNRIVYDTRQFYATFSQPNPSFELSAVKYSRQSLSECVPPQQDQNGKDISPATCTDVSNRLLPGTKYLTPPELAAWNTQQEDALLQQKESNFCKNFGSAQGSQSSELEPYFQNPTGIENNGPYQLYFATESIDLKNDGKPIELVDVGIDTGGNGSDSNDLLWNFSNQNQISQLMNFVKTALKNDLGNDANAPSPEDYQSWKGNLINFPDPWGGGITTNQPIKYQGKIYVYTSDDQPSVDPLVPSAILSEILPDNSIKHVCSFP